MAIPARILQAFLPPLPRLHSNPMVSAALPHRPHLLLPVPSVRSFVTVHDWILSVLSKYNKLDIPVQNLVQVTTWVFLSVRPKLSSELFGLFV